MDSKLHLYVMMTGLLLTASVTPGEDGLNSVTSTTNITPPSAENDGDGLWLADTREGMRRAKEQKRDLLLFFTSSDSPACAALEKVALGTPRVRKEISDRFVAVKLDFPSHMELDPSIAEINQIWSQLLRIDVLPTLCMADSNGVPYARISQLRVTPKLFLDELTKRQKRREKRDEAMRKASKVKGPDRLPYLAEALSAVDEQLVYLVYLDVIKEIVSLDPRNELGYKSRFEMPLLLTAIDVALNNHDYPRAEEISKDAIDIFPAAGQHTQDLLLRRSEALYRLGRLDEAQAALDASEKAEPNGLRIRHIRTTRLLHYSEFAEELKAIRRTLGATATQGAPDRVLRRVEAAFDRFKPQGVAAQELLIIKSQALYRMGEYTASQKALAEAIAAEPHGSAVEYIRRMQQLHLSQTSERKK